MSLEEISPFSTLQKYELVSYPYYPRPPGNLTSWEEETLSFLEDVGAGAYFQIAPKSKQRKKLDSLNRAGLVYKYQLKGERSINVSASRPYKDLKTLLKALAFTQLVIKLKEFYPVQVFPGSNFIHAHVQFNNNTFPVIVLRSGDDISMLPFLVKPLDKLIILSEKLHPMFERITIPTRILLDNDLINSNILFYLPDGRVEKQPG